MEKNDDIIKCNKCGQVLISGRNCIAVFSKGTSIECLKCGNKYVFGSVIESETILCLKQTDKDR